VNLADHPHVARLIELALEEDLPTGDATSESILGSDSRATGIIAAREACVLAGLDVARAVFLRIDAELELVAHKQDGDPLTAGDEVLRVAGNAASILTAERTALNFLQRLCGIATLTARYVERLAGTGTVLLPTRKTTPGQRVLQRHAVRCGGGGLHRGSLSDGILIKDNHVDLAGGIERAIRRARAAAPQTLKIEIETRTLDEVREAVAAGADIVMFDNMSVAEVHEALAICPEGVRTEVSGGVTLETLRDYAETGVHAISVGALTHSAPSADLGLDVVVPGGGAA